MGTTTFSGPIKAGTIKDTTGTTVGTNKANVGFVKMAQTASWTQSTDAADTGIVIPANSQITEITIYITCLLYTSPSPRDVEESRMPSSA